MSLTSKHAVLDDASFSYTEFLVATGPTTARTPRRDVRQEI